MSNNIGAVIWDLDGTLLDSGDIHYQIEKKVFDDFGIKFDRSTYKKYLSTKVSDLVSSVLEEQNQEIEVEMILSRIRSLTREAYDGEINLSKNALSVIQEIKSIGISQALATAREKLMAEVAVKRFGLNRYFEAMFFAEDVINGKPDPEVFLKAAEFLEVPANECVVIEDGMNGIIAANRANMLSVAYKSKHNSSLDFSEANFTVGDLSEIRSILKL